MKLILELTPIQLITLNGLLQEVTETFNKPENKIHLTNPEITVPSLTKPKSHLQDSIEFATKMSNELNSK